jgi:hypothetical protein
MRRPLLPVPARRYRTHIRKDPVQFRVAIPAADPPDNITHSLSTPTIGPLCLVADLK